MPDDTWFVVCHSYASSKKPEDLIWTLSHDPKAAGWETDSGHPGYGLTKAAAEELANAANSIDQMTDALHKIARWSDAYPLTVFPEPDLVKARELLKAGGVSLDAVSAHCMRHVVEGVGKIAKTAINQISDASIAWASKPP